MELATAEISGCQKVLYPFWVGYFQKGNKYDFKAVDAVSGEMMGVTMRKVILKAFRVMRKRLKADDNYPNFS